MRAESKHNMYTLLDAGDGSKYRLTQVRPIPERLIRARVFDSVGLAVSGIGVALHYDTDTLLNLDSQRLKTAWRETAFFEYTNRDGVVEFPFDLHQGAPYVLWVLSVAHKSDGAEGITSGVEVFFRLVYEQEAKPAKKVEDPLRLRSVIETVLGILEDKEAAEGMGIEHAIILLRSALEISEDL